MSSLHSLLLLTGMTPTHGDESRSQTEPNAVKVQNTMTRTVRCHAQSLAARESGVEL